MFKCENKFCGKTVPPRQPVNRIVTEQREVTYDKKIIKRGKVVSIKEVKGQEIVKEISVCPKCFSVLTGKKPKLSDQRKRPDTRKQPGFNAKPPRKKWQNPKTKQETATPSVQGNRPIVEKVNPIPIIK